MIRCENISKSFGDVQALNDVSLNVNSGELFGLIGPDGAGKTTLMRILMTLLLADKGQAQLDGLDVVKDFRKIRQMVGYMPGRFSLYQDLTVEENLRFFATVFGSSIEQNYDLISPIYKQIEPFKNRLAGRLSGGMKQKLALSCALIHRPQILVLDEPTTGVDAVSRKEFWEMLYDIRSQGITILVSTPYMDEARLCSRVALMQKGNIMKIDTTERMVSSYLHRLFAVRSDNMFRLIRDLEKWERTHTIFAFGQFAHFTSKNDEIGTEELRQYLLSCGHLQPEAKEIQPNIEDVFLEMSHGKGN